MKHAVHIVKNAIPYSNKVTVDRGSSIKKFVGTDFRLETADLMKKEIPFLFLRAYLLSTDHG